MKLTHEILRNVLTVYWGVACVFLFILGFNHRRSFFFAAICLAFFIRSLVTR